MGRCRSSGMAVSCPMVFRVAAPLGAGPPSGKDTAGVDVIFTIVQADGRTRDVPVKRPRTIVGRKPECNIRIPVSSVSREHCEVTLDGETLSIRDLGSSNGTYVNRDRVQQATLKAGDLLGIGPA